MRRLWWLAAAALAALAVSAPLDALADRSFAWHMAQHVVLLFGVPLCMLASRPFEAFVAIAGKRVAAAFVRSTRGWHAVVSPPAALLGFVAILWTTHFSSLYAFALRYPIAHAGEHALYVIAGILFWIPVLAPPPIRPPSHPVRLFYLFFALPQGALLAAAIGTARAPLYHRYAVALGVSGALADQQRAAATMWLVGGAVVLAAILATVGAWARREAHAA